MILKINHLFNLVQSFKISRKKMRKIDKNLNRKMMILEEELKILQELVMKIPLQKLKKNLKQC
jgi:hypothetical protein